MGFVAGPSASACLSEVGKRLLVRNGPEARLVIITVSVFMDSK